MRAIAPDAAGFATLPEALAALRPEVVHIVTPPATHAALARTALEAGCHVYVEKPFVEHGAEARALLDLAAARGRLVCAGHQLLHEDPSRVARDLRPAIGRLVHVESYFSFRTVRRTPDGRAPRLDLQLLDILPHPVYVLLAALDGEADGPTELAAVEVGPPGTVHALIRRGGISGTLTVSLQARPVESFLRLTGTNGTINADYVRGTVQRLIGPGTSGLEKLFAPYQIARQLVSGTTRAMAKRFLGGQRSYPGLAELFGLFYGAIRAGTASPVSPDNIADTVAFCERIGAALAAYAEQSRPRLVEHAPGPRGPVTPHRAAPGSRTRHHQGPRGGRPPGHGAGPAHAGAPGTSWPGWTTVTWTSASRSTRRTLPAARPSFMPRRRRPGPGSSISAIPSMPRDTCSPPRTPPGSGT